MTRGLFFVKLLRALFLFVRSYRPTATAITEIREFIKKRRASLLIVQRMAGGRSISRRKGAIERRKFPGF
jgi:hypothetical protein